MLLLPRRAVFVSPTCSVHLQFCSPLYPILSLQSSYNCSVHWRFHRKIYKVVELSQSLFIFESWDKTKNIFLLLNCLILPLSFRTSPIFVRSPLRDIHYVIYTTSSMPTLYSSDCLQSHCTIKFQLNLISQLYFQLHEKRTYCTMLVIMEIAIHFKWYSMKTKSSYRVIRIKYETGQAVTMTLDNGKVLILEYAESHWCEFVTLIQSSDFHVPQSHGPKGIINFNKMKTM